MQYQLNIKSAENKIQIVRRQSPINIMTNAKRGLKGEKGDPGNDGADGQGVPAGGASGQVLSKASNADYDTQWKDLDKLVYSVKDYGALGDGVTDDTNAIQSAIDDAGADGMIVSPKGVYILDPSVSLHFLDGQTFDGLGSTFKIKDAANVKDNLFKVESHNNVTLRNFIIDGNRANQDSSDLVSVNYGVYIAGSDDCRVDNVRVHHTSGVGIHVYNSIGTVVTRCDSSYNRYHGFECEQDASTIWLGNRGHHNDRHGIFVSPGEVGGMGTIGNAIDDNSFDNNGQYGIAFGIDAQGISVGLTRDNVVSNNIVTNNAHYGISLYRVDDTSITGNTITENGFFGLYIYRSQRNQIANNWFHNNSQSSNGAYDEILLEGNQENESDPDDVGKPARDNLISDNYILIDGDTKARWGINEASEGDGPNYLFGNTIPLAGTSGRIQVQHESTTMMVDDKSDQSIDGDKVFRTGFGAAAGSVIPDGAFVAIDSPFNGVGRIFSRGSMQLVTDDGPLDAYVRQGDIQNNVMSLYNDHMSMHGYKVTDVDDGVDGNDAVNVDQLESAVDGVDARVDDAFEYLGPISGQESRDDVFLRMERRIDPDKYTGRVGVRCAIPTPDPVSSNGEALHPSVIYAPEMWNGYYYWMAVTPYASSNDAYEDPIIVASNDGNTWVVPVGLTNPLDDKPGGTQYNSDTHLVFGPDNVMYVFWRYLDTSGASAGSEEKIYVRSSTDGITWTVKQLVYQSDLTVRRILSPSFHFYDGLWHMWGVDIVGTKRVVHATSTSLTGTWSTPVDCTVAMRSSRYPWHLFVSRVGDQWVGLLNDSSNSGSSGQNGDIILMVSDDGIVWDVAALPCIPRSGPDHTVQYRAAFVPKLVDGIWGFDVWYSGRSPNYVYRSSLNSIVSDMGIPYAMDSGFVITAGIASGASAAHAITFKAGLFTENPQVIATPANGRLNVAVDNATLTKNGVTINAFNWTSASAGASRIFWIAIQNNVAG